MGLVDQIRSLHEHGLFSNVQRLACLLLSLPEFKSPEKMDFSTMANRYQILIYYGDSLFADEQFKRACSYFNDALRHRKSLVKMKPKANSLQSTTSEMELKYKIYQCHMKLREYRDAIQVLEGIALKQRTSKINMSLAKLYQKQGMERSAITCYKEVLRVCPYALDAATSLLSLGVSIQEVTTLLASSSTSNNIPDWFSLYLKGQSFVSLNKHTKAGQIFKNLDSQTLKDNTDILSCQAESYWKNGDTTNAVNCYRRVRSLDSTFLHGMDIYAQILADKNSVDELEKLSQDLTHVSQSKTEPWVAVAHYCACTNRKTRAVYFAQKAHMIDTRNVQALLLKASLLQSLSKTNEALLHYREAIRLAPCYFEAYQGLVDCYLSSEQQREALTIARNAHKTIGATARTLTLYAKVLSQDSQTKEKAKTMLEKALTQDQSHLSAVYLLVEVFFEEKNYEKNVKVLRKQLELQRTARLHQLLGDNLKESNSVQEALEQYNKALMLNPNDVKAMDGIHSVERTAAATADLECTLGMPADQSFQNESVDEMIENESLPDDDMHWLQ